MTCPGISLHVSIQSPHPPPMTLFMLWCITSLTVCVFVRRHRDILQTLRPALLLRLAPGQRPRGTGSAAPAVAALPVAPLVVLLLRMLLLAHFGDVVVGVGVSGGAVEGVVAAVIPGLSEHVVGYLQALVPGPGRLQEGQRLPAALRHLLLSVLMLSPLPPSVSPVHYGGVRSGHDFFCKSREV